jgi:amino acid adenylation domain-containing protein
MTKPNSNDILETHPCSDLQVQLFYAEKMSAGGPVYNAAVAWEIRPRAEIARLSHSLATVINRHKILRSRFEQKRDVLTQVVTTNSSGDYVYCDLSERSPASSDDLMAEELKKLCRTPFDLERGPTHRTGVIEMPGNRQIIVVVMHHILCDERSFEIFFREWIEVYVKGRGPTEMPWQFSDYCQSEKVKHLPVDGQGSLFWEKRLNGHAPITLRDLAGSKKAQNDEPVQCVRIGSISTKALRLASAKLSCTPFVLVLAAFKLLLRNYTETSDVCVSTPITLRTKSVAWENTIGPFLRVLPVRTVLKDTQSLADAVLSERDAFLEAVENLETLPLDASHRLGYNSFDSQILFQWSYGDGLPDFGPFAAKSIPTPFAGLKTNLALKTQLKNDAISFSLTFRAGDIACSTAERFFDHLEILLEQMISDPTRKVGEVQLVAGEERQKLLHEHSGARRIQRKYPFVSVIEHFTEQANLNSERVAVRYGERQLTYEELDQRSSKLAWYLRDRGVKPEKVVALYLDRTLDLMVALLGVLKAGGAYVPIDLDWPQDRSKFVLEDTKPHTLLTQSKLLQRLPKHDAAAICLDADWPSIAAATINQDSGVITPESLAYIIYTSGSTGRPKGVMIEHRSLTNYVLDIVERLSLTANDVILAATNISFDISVTELVCPLIAGAEIFLTKSFRELRPSDLECAVNAGVNIIQSTPTFFHQLLAHSKAEFLNNVRTIIIGGELLSDSLVDKLREQPGARIYNAYGPTETCVWSTIKELDAKGRATVGKPLSNTLVYVLNVDQECQPENIPGEVYIAGDGLARGYLNNDEMTAERFVRLPRIGIDRAYRTGDFGAWLSDGELILLGRRDHQTKWKGYRLDLEEIDSAFRRHPAITHVATLLVENENKTDLLVCYTAREVLTVSQLSEFARRQLPPQILPTAYLAVLQMPVNSSGKVDRNRVRELFQGARRKAIQQAAAGPETQNERLLWRFWNEILARQDFGVDENFFALGGQSMGLARLQLLISEAIGREIPFMELFGRPTIRQQAYYVDGVARANSK